MEQLAVNTSVSLFIFLASAFMVIYGWDVIYENSKRISSRNETFSRKKSVIDEINKVRDISIDFWQEEIKETEKNKCLIKTQIFYTHIESIRKSIKRLQESGLEIDVTKELVNFRKSITLDSESAFEVDYQRKMDKISSIVLCSDEIKYKLSKGYESLYKNSTP